MFEYFLSFEKIHTQIDSKGMYAVFGELRKGRQSFHLGKSNSLHNRAYT